MARQIRQIAIYGKGGIGKSTIASNISATLAEKGLKVFQMGCSPKIDSTALLNRGNILEQDILSKIRAVGTTKEGFKQCIVKGYGGVLLAESGGPEPATGCAGKGVSHALDILARTRLLEELGVEFVIYDVIGDIVCGGFAQPMRSGYAQEIYIVSSGELMSVYSANNICIAIKELSSQGASVRVGGLINNMRGVPQEGELMKEFAKRLNIPILANIPRDKIVQEAEAEGGTVIEKYPESPLAFCYRELAENILHNTFLGVPTPLELEEILELLRCYQEVERAQAYISKTESPTTTTLPQTPINSRRTTNGRLRKVAFYGKGGIGKSTIAANISTALAQMGERVMQVGCDPKRDSLFTLFGRLMPTVLDELRKGPMDPERLRSVIHRGSNGIWGVESGGPRPGLGCAGGGVMEALRLLEEYHIFDEYDITFALFDVLGDVVCGGFAQPMRAGYAQEVYIVTCGEILTILQINNIAKSIKKLAERGSECACAGLINNMRGLPHEEEIVEEVAALMGLPVVTHIPRSTTVQDAELKAKTVVEAFPNSSQAQVYKSLAQRILSNDKTYIPKPLSLEEIKPIISKYAGD
jgi:nitrogenase iron protein NifH